MNEKTFPDICALLISNDATSPIDLTLCINSDEEMKELATALEQNTTLRYLHLDGSYLRTINLKPLATVIEKNKTLTFLSLRGTQLTDEGIEEIARSLKHNHTITELNLRENQITDKGIGEVAESLKHSNIVHLSLTTNQITDNGVVQLGEALKTCSSLMSLSLRDNSISDIGKKALDELVLSNRSIIFALYDGASTEALAEMCERAGPSTDLACSWSEYKQGSKLVGHIDDYIQYAGMIKYHLNDPANTLDEDLEALKKAEEHKKSQLLPLEVGV